jgi:hypothetical protein
MECVVDFPRTAGRDKNPAHQAKNSLFIPLLTQLAEQTQIGGLVF